MLLRSDIFHRLCRGRELLLEIPFEPRSIEEIAREIRISPFHFIRQFEAVFGATPHQFRIQSRLDRARLLLATGSRSVTEVCMEVGFASLGSFSRLFAERVGTSPSAYRRSARVLAQVPAGFPSALFPGCLSLMAQLPKSAFRNFREASSSPVSLECGVPFEESTYENQADQPYGGRPGQSPAVLHGGPRLSQETRDTGGSVQVAYRGLTGRTG
jgi:AraC-like DNA-binding protein